MSDIKSLTTSHMQGSKILQFPDLLMSTISRNLIEASGFSFVIAASLGTMTHLGNLPEVLPTSRAL